MHRVTYTGGSPRTIENLGRFEPGVPRELALTEAQAAALAGKGFTVVNLSVPAKAVTPETDPAPARGRTERGKGE